MKTKFILYFFILALISSCNLKEKIKDITTFDISNSASFSIPSSTIVDLPIDLQTTDINSSSQQSFKNNNTNADMVENVNLKDLTLTITNPDTRTFSFVRSIKIYIVNDEQGSTLLAERNEIPTDIGDTLEMQTTGANLDDYIKKDTYDLKYEVVIRETVNSKTDITAEMIFEVRAKVL